MTKKDARESLLRAILLPVGLLVAIVVVTVGFSRILLSQKSAAATATAMFAAVVVLGFSVTAATRTRLKGSSILMAIAGIVGLSIFFGGALLAIGGSPSKEGGAATEALTVNITAKDVLFQQTAITVPAGVPLIIAFDNQDSGIDHNVQVFDGPDSKAPSLMDGAVIKGPANASYDLEPLDAGSYYFICKIHPTTMMGTITADPNATEVSYGTAPSTGPSAGPSVEPSMAMSPTVEPSGKPSEAPAGKAVTLALVAPAGSVATGFDKTELKAPANTPITLEFDNQDPGVPHNVEIWTADPLKDPSATAIFVPEGGATITGPDKVTYSVPPMDAGTYFYRCLIHPTTMTGTLTIK